MKTLFVVACAAYCTIVAAFTWQKTLSASKAWVLTPAQGETTTTAFALIDNPTMYDVYIVSATTDAAARVEFERAAKAGDGRTEIVPQVTAPAYGTVELRRDGVHMRLQGLTRPLKSGDTVAITFATDNGAAFEVSAEVRAPSG